MKPRFLPKFPIFVQDLLASMRWQSMTAEERGCYMHLLCLQWNEGGLPADAAALLTLGSIHGLPADHPLVVEAFPVCPDGFRRNAKCLSVRSEADAYCDEQARKSALGVAARQKQPAGQPADNPVVNPRSTPPTPTPTPTPNSDSLTPPPPSKGGVAKSEKRHLRPEDVKGTCLDTPRFLSTWPGWEQVHGKYKPLGLKAQITRIAAWGEARAVAAIQYSIAQGSQGIYEERVNGNGHTQKTTRFQNGSGILVGGPEWIAKYGARP